MNMLSINGHQKLLFWLIIGFLVSHQLIFAQINSQAINDTVFAPGQMSYDFDNDATNDFTFEIITLTSNVYAARAIALGTNRVLDNSTFGYADALSSGAAISGNFVSGSVVLGTIGGGGLYSGVGNKYLGIELNSGSGTFYGWVEIICSSNNDTLQIVGFGYNTVNQGSINAGQGSSTLVKKNIKKREHTALTYTNESILIIGKEDTYSFEIYDIQGSLISNGVSLNNSISFMGVKQGIYTVLLSNNEVSLFTKIIIIRP